MGHYEEDGGRGVSPASLTVAMTTPPCFNTMALVFVRVTKVIRKTAHTGPAVGYDQQLIYL